MSGSDFKDEEDRLRLERAARLKANAELEAERRRIIAAKARAEQEKMGTGDQG